MMRAPVVKLKTGECCIPQHYLQYHHTLSTIQKVVLDCAFDRRFPIFAGKEDGEVYIQIGIIGYDNYKPIRQQTKQKIVYGRKWRIERNYPTSELVQTVFLALKKAREHEVRELFRLSIDNKVATPFSSHQDLPLMTQQASMLRHVKQTLASNDFFRQLIQLSKCLSFDDTKLIISHVECRSTDQILVDCMLLGGQDTQLAENKKASFTLVLKSANPNEMLFALMDELIHRSNRFVEENFSYRSYKRFSRETDIVSVAELSLDARSKTHIDDRQFLGVFENTNYENDKTRAPKLSADAFSQKLLKRLDDFGELEGVLPQF